jgi:RNA polymerase sigma-70 factor (ECF subfamily)
MQKLPEDNSRSTNLFTASDIELVNQSKQDPEVFGVLMTRYEAPLRRYLMRLTGWGSEEVSDILQETFIKTYQHLNDFDEELKFSTWLYRITHNQAIDTLRANRARPPISVLTLEDAAQFVPAKSDVESEFLLREDIVAVRKAILSLPILYREVLILRYLEELSYEEIMDILKKPKGSVATLIKRGRVLLLNQLQKAHSETYV